MHLLDPHSGCPTEPEHHLGECPRSFTSHVAWVHNATGPTPDAWMRRSRTVGSRPPRRGPARVDPATASPRQQFERLDAPEVWARDEPDQALFTKQAGYPHRLAPPDFGQGRR